jgi:aerobic-type carbon monoxide dehydrogenase small subunit (CoxS/CutS family)
MSAKRIALAVNGKREMVEVDPEKPLLWVLRDDLRLTGAKYGCGAGLCGACTVHLDGKAERSCTLPVGAVGSRAVVTIEGLARGNRLHPVQQAWIEEDVAQCGYCQAGQIMTVAALLAAKPRPTEADVAAIPNICRCGTYPRVRLAIASAAKKMRGGS